MPNQRDVVLTRGHTSFLSENPVVSSIMYAMKITFIFILVLFVDSVQRVYRVQLELAIANEKISKGGYAKLQPPNIFCHPRTGLILYS